MLLLYGSLLGSSTGEVSVSGATLTSVASFLVPTISAEQNVLVSTWVLSSSSSLISGSTSGESSVQAWTQGLTSSLIPGSVSAQRNVDLVGSTLSSTSSFLPGSVSAQRNVDLVGSTFNLSSSWLPGLASSSSNVSINPATNVLNSSFIPGSASAQRNVDLVGLSTNTLISLIGGEVNIGVNAQGLSTNLVSSLIPGSASAQKNVEVLSLNISSTSTFIPGVVSLGVNTLVDAWILSSTTSLISGQISGNASSQGLSKVLVGSLINPEISGSSSLEIPLLTSNSSFLPGSVLAVRNIDVPSFDLSIVSSLLPGVIQGSSNVGSWISSSNISVDTGEITSSSNAPGLDLVSYLFFQVGQVTAEITTPASITATLDSVSVNFSANSQSEFGFSTFTEPVQLNIEVKGYRGSTSTKRESVVKNTYVSNPDSSIYTDNFTHAPPIVIEGAVPLASNAINKEPHKPDSEIYLDKYQVPITRELPGSVHINYIVKRN